MKRAATRKRTSTFSNKKKRSILSRIIFTNLNRNVVSTRESRSRVDARLQHEMYRIPSSGVIVASYHRPVAVTGRRQGNTLAGVK